MEAPSILTVQELEEMRIASGIPATISREVVKEVTGIDITAELQATLEGDNAA